MYLSNKSIIFFKIGILALAFLLSDKVYGQPAKNSMSIGFFAPYGIQYGAKLGATLSLKDWGANSENNPAKYTRVSTNPQIGYFVYPDVQHNIFINNEFVLSRYRPNKRFFPMASIGTGYLIALQNVDGTVNLATGDISNRTETLHYFVPTVNIGFGITPKNNIGFHAKAFYGRKFGFDTESASFLGIELGIFFNLSNKTQ